MLTQARVKITRTRMNWRLCSCYMVVDGPVGFWFADGHALCYPLGLIRAVFLCRLLASRVVLAMSASSWSARPGSETDRMGVQSLYAVRDTAAFWLRECGNPVASAPHHDYIVEVWPLCRGHATRIVKH